MAATTIQVDKSLKKQLDAMKIHPRETYNDIINRILEDLEEINERTKKELQKARKEIEDGKSISHEQLRKEMGL